MGPAIDSARERRDIANGGWLMIGQHAAGECLIARGGCGGLPAGGHFEIVPQQ